MMKERKAIQLIEAIAIESAITACSSAWASFPGNNYGQGGHNMDVLLEKYKELFGG
jgi:muramidase (phage lysozyme)